MPTRPEKLSNLAGIQAVNPMTTWIIRSLALVMTAVVLMLGPIVGASTALTDTDAVQVTVQATTANVEVPDPTVLLSGRAFADVDGDGDLDRVSPANQSNVIWLWLNDGSGLFTPSQLLTTHEERTTFFVFGDLNQDNAPDLVSANRDTPNYVWLNDGEGNLVLTQTDLGNSDSRNVALGDLDGDGDLDIIVANANDTGNELWFNDGSGHFTDLLMLGQSAASVAIADLDRDGDMDVILAPMGGDGVHVWLNDGVGNFEIVLYPAQIYSRRVKLGDLDQDGDLDAVFACGLGTPNYVWFNDGSGTFTLSQTLGDDDSMDVKIGDMDNDDDLDLVFSNRLGRGNTIWFNNGSGKFFENIAFGQLLGDSSVRNLQLRDLDDDGDLDATFGTTDISIWFNQTSQGMPGEGIYQPGVGVIADAAVEGQRSQLISQNLEYVTIINPELIDMNHGELPFQLAMPQLGRSTSADVKLGDLDRDGDLDVVFANYFGEQSQVWFNDGLGSFTLNQLLSDGSSFTVALGDLNDDGALDVVLPKRVLKNEIWLNDGSGHLNLTQSLDTLGEDTRSSALGDLDGDGDLDIVFGTAFTEKIRIWLNDGSGVFTLLPQSFGDSIGRVDSVVLGDLDGDDDLDLMFVNAFEEGNEVWFNEGHGYFSLAQAGLGDANSRNLDLGDFDLDGDLDVIFANIAGEYNEVWSNDGSGHFSFSEGLPSTNKGMALGDWDNDGDLDVFFGQSNGKDGNGLWLNDGSGHFTELASIKTTSSHAVDLGDLNGDGRLDMVSANIGQNENSVLFSNPDFVFPQ